MMIRGYVSTRNGQVHLRRAGDCGPMLVLLHETPLSSAVFEPALPHLARWCRAVAFDTPGYGSSDPPLEPPDLAGYGMRLVEAIREVTDEPVLLCGVHTGASFAVEIARQEPGLVAGIALLGLPAYEPAERAQMAQSFAPSLAPIEDGTHLLRAWRHYQRIWPHAPVARRHRAVAEMLANEQRFDWAYRAVFRYDPVAALTRVSCPVLAMAAEWERLRPATERVATQLGLRFVVIEGVAGQVPASCPEQFSTLLKEFAGA